MGDLSPHFSRWEFRCKHCSALVGPTEHLLAVLEALRDMKQAPLNILSGYRCPAHNRAVGGSPTSQHPHGAAADFAAGAVTLAWARAAGVHGCGVRRGQVVHVDVRPGRSFHTFRD